jgi:hypothetical protein
MNKELADVSIRLCIPGGKALHRGIDCGTGHAMPKPRFQYYPLSTHTRSAPRDTRTGFSDSPEMQCRTMAAINQENVR